jgi:hypothetical protein
MCEAQGFGDAQAGAKKHGQERMVAQSLVGTVPWPRAQRLRCGVQAYFIKARQSLPVGGRFRWRLDALGRTAQRE